MELARTAVSSGVRWFSIGSDAHSAAEPERQELELDRVVRVAADREPPDPAATAIRARSTRGPGAPASRRARPPSRAGRPRRRRGASRPRARAGARTSAPSGARARAPSGCAAPPGSARSRRPSRAASSGTPRARGRAPRAPRIHVARAIDEHVHLDRSQDAEAVAVLAASSAFSASIRPVLGRELLLVHAVRDLQALRVIGAAMNVRPRALAASPSPQRQRAVAVGAVHLEVAVRRGLPIRVGIERTAHLRIREEPATLRLGLERLGRVVEPCRGSGRHPGSDASELRERPADPARSAASSGQNLAERDARSNARRRCPDSSCPARHKSSPIAPFESTAIRDPGRTARREGAADARAGSASGEVPRCRAGSGRWRA